MQEQLIPAFPAMGYAPNLYDEDLPSIKEEPSNLNIPAYKDQELIVESTEGEDAVKVAIRVRPPLTRELKGFTPFDNAVLVDATSKRITLSENLRAAANNGIENGLVYNTYSFSFDKVYSHDCTQEEIYYESAQTAVHNVLQGYNASIIAFGQTGAGKTFTMTGELTGTDRGIIPRAIEDVFNHIEKDTSECSSKYLVRASYLQIYNEVISDLLKLEATNLTTREDKKGCVRVEGLSEWVVRTPKDVYELMERGARNRATGATKLNELSSRSHAIFQLTVEKSTILAAAPEDANGGFNSTAAGAAMKKSNTGLQQQQIVRVGKLNLVDLAGSERVHVTGATGRRLEESKKINQSLSALGNVIAALTDPKGRNGRPHIPYRDSKLTRILEDSLGGNCKTTFLAMVSPAVEAFQESLSTLKFAHRAKCVKNAPKVNEDADQKTLLRKYERELKKLRAELQQKSKDLVDKRLLLQIEEARRREQADKIAAITALERQSKEIARHKQAMASLQNRIASMQSQLLIGGQKVEDTPQFKTMLAREQARIRQEYESKLSDLEHERQAMQEDKAQVTRYKSLLLKQRDIMVTLTHRLNERDEQVLALQAQVEVLSAREKELEDALDEKTGALISLEKALELQAAARKQQQHDDGDVMTVVHDVPALQSNSGELVVEEDTAGPQEVVFGSDDEDSIDSPVKAPTTRTRVMDIKAPKPTTNDDNEAAATNIAIINKQKQQLAKVTVDYEALKEERQALKTILDTKVMGLISDLTSSIGELPGEAQEHPRLNKQLDYLKKIVKATVQAMGASPSTTSV